MLALSTKETICMKFQILFSSKTKKKYFKISSAEFFYPACKVLMPKELITDFLVFLFSVEYHAWHYGQIVTFLWNSKLSSAN